MPMERTMFFGDFDRRVRRATGRAAIGVGVAVATETKRVTHVGETGNLRRSVHAAPAGYSPDETEEIEAASRGDILDDHVLTHEEVSTPFGAILEVGSWMPYACVEWVGRQHPGVTQGLEAVMGLRANAIVHEAFRQEGL